MPYLQITTDYDFFEVDFYSVKEQPDHYRIFYDGSLD